MKKIISLVIALTLIISMFSVVSVAFAEGETVEADHATVTFDKAKLEEKIAAVTTIEDFYISDGEFKGWLTTGADVREVFPNANFYTEGEAGYVAEDKDNYDKVRLEYCTGYPRSDSNWTKDSTTNVVKDGAKIDLDEVGYVAFRYVVEYKVKSTDTKTVKVTSESEVKLIRWVEDRTAPTAKLSTNGTLETQQKNGLTEGTTFTISTSGLTITDSSTTTTTYVVKKGGKVVYDSKTGVAEDYTGEDIKDGKITPTAADVSADTVYTIVYTVTDAVGFKSEPVECNLFVKAKTVTETEDNNGGVDVLKIVLYVIAGLSAAGIVVLLFIKPKKAEETTGRVVYTDDNNDAE